MQPFLRGEKFICMDRKLTLRPQQLIIDIADNTTDCVGFANRSIESIFEKDTIRRIGKKYQLLIEFKKGYVDTNNEVCLAPILGEYINPDH